MKISVKKRGIGLVEIVVAVAIVLLVITASIAANVAFVKVSLSNINNVKASFLITEGVEVAKLMRDESWSANIASLSSGVPYNIEFVSAKWQTTSSNIVIDSIFTRTLVFDDVYRRDSDDEIVPSSSPDSKTLDPKTRKLTVAVSWGSDSDSVSTYLTDIIDN